jgi:hypothetical protein
MFAYPEIDNSAMITARKIALCRLVLLTAFALPFLCTAQKQNTKRKHEIYFSWGYNTEWYTHSNIHLSQPALGNDYTFEHVSGHDHRGWDGQFFTKALSIPQYNYRLGYILNEQKGLGIEINFDHTKFIFSDNQLVHIKGTVSHANYDGHVLFSQDKGDSSSYYYLNNGANFLLFNLVKRSRLFSTRDKNLQVDFLGKAGFGPVIPHVENEFFGDKNDPHFQLGGWNIGLEAALRATICKYVYLEYSNKVDYARYSGLRVYDGTVKQAFGTYEMVLSLGFNLPVGKKLL